MTTSRFFAAYNGLLTAVQTALAATTVVIFDGPQPVLPTDRDFVVLGCSALGVAGAVRAIDAGEQDWADLGALHRDEMFTIHSVYKAWTGDNDLPACRTRAQTNIGLVETQLKADLTLGGALPSGWCSLSLLSMDQRQDKKTGTGVEVVFSVVCKARI